MRRLETGDRGWRQGAGDRDGGAGGGWRQGAEDRDREQVMETGGRGWRQGAGDGDGGQGVETGSSGEKHLV